MARTDLAADPNQRRHAGSHLVLRWLPCIPRDKSHVCSVTVCETPFLQPSHLSTRPRPLKIERFTVVGETVHVDYVYLNRRSIFHMGSHTLKQQWRCVASSRHFALHSLLLVRVSCLCSQFTTGRAARSLAHHEPAGCMPPRALASCETSLRRKLFQTAPASPSPS